MMWRMLRLSIFVVLIHGCVGEYPEYEEPKAEAERAREEAEAEAELARQEAEAARQEVLDSIEWVTIEGGDFMMGSDNGNSDERPRHTVSVPTFQIMKTEVTVEMYRVCVNAGECSDSGGQNKSHPAVLNWYQLNEFAAYVGERLPTEAEWEYAARSDGREINYPWGDESPTCTLAQKGGCDGQTAPVCSKPAGHTDQGLCDMAGNVWEWVQDEYHSSYDGAPSNGSGWCASYCSTNTSGARRVLRGGGSVYSTKGLFRVASRHNGDPSSRRGNYGGRVARSIF